MRVRCSVQCGFRQDGQPLLNEGETVLDEGSLTYGEREFIQAMVDSKLAEYVKAGEVPRAPASETKLIGAASDIAGADAVFPAHAAVRKQKKGRGR